MQRVFTDHQLRESLRARGFDRAKGFTWRGTAEQTLAAYTQLAHARAPRQLLSPAKRSFASPRKAGTPTGRLYNK
jgi:hypothetical protein